MKRKLTSVYVLFATLLSGYLFLSSSANPPNGYTGSPADGGNTCSALNNGCHTGPTGTGNVTIAGLPSSIVPNTNYSITVTVTRTNPDRQKGGFQLMVLDGNDQNVGNLSTTDPNAATQIFNGFEYFEHDPALSFSSNSVTYTGSWVAPASAVNPITMYIAANLAGSPSGSNDGDEIVTTTVSGDMSGGGVITVDVTGTNVSCFGGNNGSATATPSGGGGPPFSYSWSNGGSTATINNLTAGTYMVTVTNTSGGMGTGSVTITQPASAVAVSVINSSNITCANPTGSATASASGGTPGYTYNWSSGATGATVSLPAGTWTVTATDNNGCTATDNV
ncbi:MAG: choice-of-anchor V domain-containing protein, partial [Bacteroidota bacterium]